MGRRVFQIFRSGLHTPAEGEAQKFSDADLQGMADSFSPAVRPAPLVIGHPKVEEQTFGQVQRLVRHDDALYAIADVSDQLVEWVRSARYKNVSASLFPPGSMGNPVPDKFYLRHVGFLGAQPPAVKGMQPLAFVEASHSSPLCFSAPHGYAACDSRMELYVIARDLQLANPALSIIDAAVMAERFLNQ